jgi:hypothetical protein
MAARRKLTSPKRVALLAAAAALVALASMAVLTLLSHGQRASADSPFSDASADARFKACDAPFDHYTAGAGAAFHGLSAGPRIRQCVPPKSASDGPPLRTNVVQVSYGDCHAGDEQACSPPLTVQSWPACERNLSLYERYSGPPGEDPVPHTPLTVRGAPAASFDDGRRIEVYTGDATVVIFADENPQLGLAAANALVGVHAGRLVNASATLPAPAAGAMAGRLSC